MSHEPPTVVPLTRRAFLRSTAGGAALGSVAVAGAPIHQPAAGRVIAPAPPTDAWEDRAATLFRQFGGEFGNAPRGG